MRKIEVLAPAGTMEALRAAVLNGADAIYCGGSNFGARAFAGNFNHEEMEEAVKYCHLFGVKLYVTMNTLLFEDEIKNALKEVDFYYSIGVDALIVQDLGLFDLVRQQYPDIELHCSTQMHVHNRSGVKTMKELGASRVVLARETPIELIEECCKEGLDIEVFVYGALCVSYSGQCLMSSALSNRSGNRGACAQYCRMQYELVNKSKNELIKTDGEYLLSPKDLNLLNNLPRLLDCGVTSLKIEGRMKRPEYVGLVTRTFRDAVDSYMNNQLYRCLPERLNELKLLFNRGFTVGHVFNDKGSDIMSMWRPNHIGLPLGKVVYADRDSFQIKLDMPLHQHDGLRICGNHEDLGFIAHKIIKDGNYVNRAEKGDVVTFEDKRFVQKGALVLKTTDVAVMEEAILQNPYRRIPIYMNVQLKIGQPFVLEVSDGIHTIRTESNLQIQAPLKAPIDEQRLFEQLTKLNDTPYEVVNIEGDMIPFFLPIKEINETRRRCIEQLSELRMTPPVRKKGAYLPPQLEQTTAKPLVEVNSVEQANVVSQFEVSMTSTNADVQQAYPSLIIQTPVVNEASLYPTTPCVIQDVGGLSALHKVAATAALNVTNSYAMAMLYSLGVQMIECSTECTKQQQSSSINAFISRHSFAPSLCEFTYGKRDLMVLKTCVVNNVLGDGYKKNCQLCKKQNFVLKDNKGNEYKLMGDDQCIQHLLESEPVELEFASKLPIYVRFSDENSSQVAKVMKSQHFLEK